MIVITGAAGFIGSCLAQELHRKGSELLLVDDFSRPDKAQNLRGLESVKKMDRMDFLKNLPEQRPEIIYHLGARTDTTEFDKSIFDELNLNYSKALWNYAVERSIPFIYASSAATYGDGALGFDDDESIIPKLLPLNPYGESKHAFDCWVLKQEKRPPIFVGLKFFNVYGPNENHKGRMASVVYHTFHQIQKTGGMKLFESHRSDYQNGEQSRDFIYVKDVVRLLEYWGNQREHSGIFNVGSGQARPFNDLAKAVFNALGLEPNISYIPTPEDIRDTYQYFTEASMVRTRWAGYAPDFYALESGVSDYVKNYLVSANNF
jgi:ADP-L-glycero-D-manno-heptose 6-epimerase